MLNAFTVDVEDYYQVSAFEKEIDRTKWSSMPQRVECSTRRILDILAENEVQGTFFILGWVADRYPQLVKDIQAAGHEIGSHSYWHRLVYSMSPKEFREDLRRSRLLLEDITGNPVTAFRAPSFSITQKSLWAFDVLGEEGFTVDSSVFPIHHDRYGIPDAEPKIHQRETLNGHIWEFPPSVLKVAGLNVPVSGGGYFRLYPGAFLRQALRSVNRKLNRPFMFYIHPWEVDHEQPRLNVGSRMTRFRHYVNLSKTENKLQRLLRSFKFGRMSDVISQQESALTSGVV